LLERRPFPAASLAPEGDFNGFIPRQRYPRYTQLGDLKSCPKELLEPAGSKADELPENAASLLDT